MSASPPINLYNLLPALYRIRDASNGYQLRAFLQIISNQANIVKGNIDGLWDDLFIETCAPWVIPYIGDLVANNPLHDVGIGVRGDVAHTIKYRRRKGTLAMLEMLARDVTRWGAHAVAFFEELGWTQNLNHERMALPVSSPPVVDPHDPFCVDRVGTVNLRDLDTLDKIDGPFDITTHTIDVRPICQSVGWYNIKKVGFFLWRLRPYALSAVTPRKSTHYADGYHFSPLGNPAPLFTQPPLTIQDMKQIIEFQAPGPIRPAAFYFHAADYYPPATPASFAIYDGTNPMVPVLYPLKKIVCRDLSGWTPPPPGFIAVDVVRGRLAFAPGESPAGGVLADFSYGFSGDMGGGPYDRRPVAIAESAAPVDCSSKASAATYPDTLDQPNFFGTLIQVPSGATTTITQGLASWVAAGSPPAVIQITNSDTYKENLTINLPANGVLVIQAANQERPVLLGNIVVRTAANTTASLFMLSGFVVAGQLHTAATLEALDIVHSTLVPGLDLDENGDPVDPDTPSLLVDTPNANLQVLIDHSITGALQVPEDVLGLTVLDSIVDSPVRSAQAEFSPVLLSGNLSPFPAIGAANPVVNVTIGDEGPYPAAFPVPPKIKPTTLADARDQLQTAIRSAHNTVTFTSARVLVVGGNRLAVLPGTDEVVVIENTDTDHTAGELRLDPNSARQTFAIISGALPPAPGLTATPPSLNVTIDSEGLHEAVMPPPFGTLPQIRDSLQLAVRAAFASPAFTGTLVALADNQLIVIPGGTASAITLSTVPTDRTTLFQLKLESERPAIAGDPGGDLPGPPTKLERTTVFGLVHVQELVLASEVIFVNPVTSMRRQTGCVRFSFVPEGSVTPRRFRCQPDLEIDTETGAAEKAAEAKGTTLTATQKDAIRDDVRSWLMPVFTDIHYGLPAYTQLAYACPVQIKTGAEDGSEMGAFSFLKQPQRETNLRVRLREYLPFGLEAGLIYVT